MRILLLLICAATHAAAALREPAELALKIAAVVEANLEKSRAYAYRHHQVTARLDKNGKQLGQHSQTWEVIGLEGVRYRKLVQRDDKPLPLKEAAKRRADRAGGRKLFSALSENLEKWPVGGDFSVSSFLGFRHQGSAPRRRCEA